MPVCSPALWLTAAALTTTIAANGPKPADLTGPTWCYATKAGQEVESWQLKPDGTAEVTRHVHRGYTVNQTFAKATWRLKRNVLIIRVPKLHRLVLKIEEVRNQRLHFKNENQAVPCRPRA